MYLSSIRRFVTSAATTVALPWLGTEDDRLPAIRLYLSLGWQAHLYAEDMTARWRDVFARLGLAFSLAACVSSPAT